MPISFRNSEDLGVWHKYAYTMPIKRKTMVASKYVSVLLFLAISIAVSMILYGVSVAVFDNYSRFMVMFIITCSVVVSLLLPTFALPIIFRFSADAYKVINVILFFGGGIIGLLICITMDISDTLFTLTKSNKALFIAGVAMVIALILFGISYLISVKCYKKRDL